MANKCPYCQERARNSGDHIFPIFLGGSRKVKCCKICNENFGSRFEGPVSKDLYPVMVFLSYSGYKHKKTVRHKKAWVDPETGVEYDMDSDGNSLPSRPRLIPLEDGGVKVVGRSMAEVEQIRLDMTRKGKYQAAGEIVRTNERRRPQLSSLRISISAEIRQLAVKMCSSLAMLLAPNELMVGETARRYVVTKSPRTRLVQMMTAGYPGLDNIRPALAHTIYVRGDPATRKCYGVVQFFGCFASFYVPLNNAYVGPDLALLGTLDITNHRESFDKVPALSEPSAPVLISNEQTVNFFDNWGAFINEEVKRAFGKNGVVFNAASKQAFLGGLHVSLPLIWIEYKLEFEFALRLLVDRDIENPPPMPNSPKEWKVSSDYGNTLIPVFEHFIAQWNSNALPSDPKVEHDYVPKDIGPGARILMGDMWLPIEKLTLRYRVQREAWLGQINLTDCSGELDRERRVVQTNIRLAMEDIPFTRDPKWQGIADPDKLIAETEEILILERRTFDSAVIKFDGGQLDVEYGNA